MVRDITFTYNVLIGQGAQIIHRHRLIGGTWILIGIVLTYGYQGKNIEELAAPLPKFKYENLLQLLKFNFTLYSATADDDRWRSILSSNTVFLGSGNGGLLVETQTVSRNNFKLWTALEIQNRNISKAIHQVNFFPKL